MQYARAKETGDRIKLELCRDDRAEVDVPLAIRRADELRKKLGYTSFEGDTLEIHESGMLTFPILGTQAPIQDKLSYDPDRSKRRRFILRLWKCSRSIRYISEAHHPLTLYPIPMQSCMRLICTARDLG